MSLKGILFDKDGTLIHFDETWGPAVYEVMREMAEGDEAVFERLGALNHFVLAEKRFLPSSPLISGTSASYGHLWAQALGRQDHPDLHAEMDRRLAAWGLRTMAPIGEPLTVLQVLIAAGYRVGIATNDAEAAAWSQAERLGLVPHLDFVAGYDSGHGEKPGPGMVLAFAGKLGLAPAEVALVGDSRHDMHAARAAGAVAIAVLTGPAGREDLEPLADHVIDSIAELPALLASLG
jgi:phosphoglycolate phosphatase